MQGLFRYLSFKALAHEATYLLCGQVLAHEVHKFGERGLHGGVLAADESATNSVVRLEDGIYIEVTVGETSVRATNTKNGYKKMCVEIVATKSSRRPN